MSGSERRRWPAVLAALALVWLAATLWAAYRTLAGAPTGTSIAVAQAAISLPTVVAACLLAGTGGGLLSLAGLARGPLGTRRLGAATERPGGRALIGAAGAVPVAVLGMLAIVLAYGTGRFIVTIAATVAIAALLGGAACALRPTAIVAAGLAGALATLVIGLAKGAFAGRLSGMFGAGDTAASQLNADANLQLAISVLGGLVAGLVAYRYLRSSGVPARWPAYLLAGGFAGLFLLVAEVVVRLGGARLLEVAKSTSPADRAVLDYLGSQRLNHALVVFFVGAVTAMIAVGRTLQHRDPEPADQGQTS